MGPYGIYMARKILKFLQMGSRLFQPLLNFCLNSLHKVTFSDFFKFEIFQILKFHMKF